MIIECLCPDEFLDRLQPFEVIANLIPDWVQCVEQLFCAVSFNKEASKIQLLKQFHAMRAIRKRTYVTPP